MELLKPWLYNDLLQEVKRVVDWLQQGDNLHVRGGVIEGRSWEDDGSNLRITPANQGQCTQILKFEQSSEPVRAAISDSQTRISATFAINATQEYQEKDRRNFTKGTLRGLLQLLDYEIVSTPLGPKRSHLTLFVRKFRYLGPTDTRGGSVPRPIEDVGDTPSLLARLAQQWKRRDSTQSNGTSTSQSSPRASGVDSPASGFASQRPLFKPDHPGFMSQLPSTLHMSNLINVKATHTVDEGPFVKPKKMPFDLSGDVHDQRGIMDDKDLLRMLSTKQTDQSSAMQGNSTEGLFVDQYSESTSSRDVGEMSPLQEVRDIGATQENAGAGDEAYEVSECLHSNTFIGRPAESILQGRCPTPDPRIFPEDRENVSDMSPRKRIRSKVLSARDVRIPKDQDILLARDDCWIPAAPGRQETLANVPTHILKLLNARADRRAKRTKPPPVGELHGSNTAFSDTINRSVADNENDEFAESDAFSWSASSTSQTRICEDLPPDSSVPSPPLSRPSTPLQQPQTQTSLMNFAPKTPPDQPFTIGDGMQSPSSSPEAAQLNIYATNLRLPFDSENERDVNSGPHDQASQSRTLSEGLKGIDGLAVDPLTETLTQDGSAEQNACHFVPTTAPEPTESEQPAKQSLRFLQQDQSIVDISTLPTAEDSEEELSIHSPTDDFSSTMPSNQVPFTQVVRTPYVNGTDSRWEPHLTNQSQAFTGFNDPSMISGSPYSNTNPFSYPFVPQPSENVCNMLPSPEIDESEATKTDRQQDITEDYFSSPKQHDLIAFEYSDTLKRKDSLQEEHQLPANKKVKLSDLLPTNLTQAEEVRPGDTAASIRRLFFERKGSASSGPESSSVSPSKPTDDPWKELFSPQVDSLLPPLSPCSSEKDDSEDFGRQDRRTMTTADSQPDSTHHVITDSESLTKIDPPPHSTSNPTGDSHGDSQTLLIRDIKEPWLRPKSQNTDEENGRDVAVDLRQKRSTGQDFCSNAPQNHQISTEAASRTPPLDPSGYRSVNQSRDLSTEQPVNDHTIGSKEADAIGGTPAVLEIRAVSKVDVSSSSGERPPHHVHVSKSDDEDAHCGAVESTSVLSSSPSGQDPSTLTDADQKVTISFEKIETMENLSPQIGVDQTLEGSQEADEVRSLNEFVNNDARRADNEPSTSSSDEPLDVSSIITETANEGVGESITSQNVLSGMSTEDREVDILNQVALESQPGYTSRSDVELQRVIYRSAAGSQSTGSDDPGPGVMIGDANHSRGDGRLGDSRALTNLYPVTQEVTASDTDDKTLFSGISSTSLRPSHPETLYARFKAAYPEYSGSSKHFTTLCSKIARVIGGGGFMPRYLWDDFVIRQKLEYSDYIQQCVEEGADPLSYENYYSQKIDEPRFTKKIISKADLDVSSASPSAAANSSQTGQHAVASVIAASRKESVASAQSCEESASSLKPEVIRAASPEIELSIGYTHPKRTVLATPKESPSKVETIDLTLDEEPELSFQPTPTIAGRAIHETPKSNRKLPWQQELHHNQPLSQHAHSSPLNSSIDQTRGAPRSVSRSHRFDRSPLQPMTSISFDLTTTNKSSQHERTQPSLSSKNNDSHHIRSTQPSTEKPAKGGFDWRDPHTPFKQWVRNYNGIQPARGNSYATEADVKRGKAIQKRRLALRPKNEPFDLRRLE